MNKMTLKDCCAFQEGYVNPSQKIRDYFNGPIKWLRASDLNDGFVYNTEQTLSIKGFESAGKSAFLFNANTIAISKSGTIGRLGILKDRMCGNRAVINIDVNKQVADLFYVFYTLIYKKSEILSKAGGSIQKNLYVSALETISLNHKDLKTQKSIAKVLSDIDAKIELNNRINAELEAMAKTLYDYWFVQFDFPDANGKPYKSSCGLMVWNEQLKRKIPVGWEVGNLLMLSNLEGGGTPSKANDEYWNGNIPFYTPTDYTNSIFTTTTQAFITQNGLDSCSSKLFPKGTIFITARGTVGNITIASTETAMNQSCYAFCPKPSIDYGFLYFSVKSLIRILKAKSGGSVFNSIVSNDIKQAHLAIPPTTLVQKFAEISSPIFEKILTAHQENQHLASLRDWLLPMLMNGQVTVCEAEKEIVNNEKPTINLPEQYEQRFKLWLNNQGVAARGDIDTKTLRDIFDAMDDEDK